MNTWARETAQSWKEVWPMVWSNLLPLSSHKYHLPLREGMIHHQLDLEVLAFLPNFIMCLLSVSMNDTLIFHLLKWELYYYTFFHLAVYFWVPPTLTCIAEVHAALLMDTALPVCHVLLWTSLFLVPWTCAPVSGQVPRKELSHQLSRQLQKAPQWSCQRTPRQLVRETSLLHEVWGTGFC